MNNEENNYGICPELEPLLVPVYGYGDRYVISLLSGKIYSRKTKNALIAYGRNNKPYSHLKVKLYDGKGSRKAYYVHRLVYSSAYGPIPDDKQVDHKDQDSRNNYIFNLQLLTQSENIKKKSEHRRSQSKQPEIQCAIFNNAGKIERILKRLQDASLLLKTPSKILRTSIVNGYKINDSYTLYYIDENLNPMRIPQTLPKRLPPGTKIKVSFDCEIPKDTWLYVSDLKNLPK